MFSISGIVFWHCSRRSLNGLHRSYNPIFAYFEDERPTRQFTQLKYPHHELNWGEDCGQMSKIGFVLSIRVASTLLATATSDKKVGRSMFVTKSRDVLSRIAHPTIGSQVTSVLEQTLWNLEAPALFELLLGSLELVLANRIDSDHIDQRKFRFFNFHKST